MEPRSFEPQTSVRSERIIIDQVSQRLRSPQSGEHDIECRPAKHLDITPPEEVAQDAIAKLSLVMWAACHLRHSPAVAARRPAVGPAVAVSF